VDERRSAKKANPGPNPNIMWVFISQGFKNKVGVHVILKIVMENVF
jgi:hypothetical protein